jgi:hypothetical protein
MAEEDRWIKLEEIVRRVVREEIAGLKKKGKTALKLVNGRWDGLTPELMESLKGTYPAVDIDAELKAAATWCMLNPNDAPISDWGRFVGTWLRKEQNKSSIRSIHNRQEPGPARKLCAYCDQVATGMVTGTWHCRAHVQQAMDGEAVPRMRGVQAKAVSGS